MLSAQLKLDEKLRKLLSHIMRKNALCAFLVLPLIVSMTLMNGSVYGIVTVISLNPLHYTAPAPDHSFTVDVNITGVTNLYAFVLELSYDTNILDAIEVVEGPVVPPYHYGDPIINETSGRVSFTCSFVTPAEPFSGSGTLMTISFNATAGGSCNLHFEFTRLFNPVGGTIVHNTRDGSVTVIPEFPAFMVVPLLLVLALAATLLGKMVWLRERRKPATTK